MYTLSLIHIYIGAVMDGELDGFINAYLTAEATGNWAEK